MTKLTKLTKIDIDNLTSAIDSADAWRGAVTGDPEMVDDHDHNIRVMNQSLQKVKELRKAQTSNIRDLGFGNVREVMKLVQDWLGWQDENLSFGLRNMDDAFVLWRAAMASTREDEGEMADTWTSAARKRVLGYDPMRRRS